VAISVDELVRELRDFRNRRQIINSMKAGIRKPVPAVRKKIRANAKATLPKGGGLNAWVASVRINVQVKLTGYKAVGIRLKGGRNSAGGRSDMDAINRGRVRAPAWGRRGAGDWHTQLVQPEFFTKPAGEATEWAAAVDGEVDRVLNMLRGV
jgi:hypothetical protein